MSKEPRRYEVYPEIIDVIVGGINRSAARLLSDLAAIGI